jgi:hypothetical protein
MRWRQTQLVIGVAAALLLVPASLLVRHPPSIGPTARRGSDRADFSTGARQRPATGRSAGIDVHGVTCRTEPAG